ncbi:Dipeptidyl aminopeptidase/acylaminoacyl peptidase [Thalassobacillus cyri]|uniref:Dipeptidyl aminopeptidase/acylaminoacyl peptidase n=1 Tax=Thalassobacillus cyri TaxID=571932 RepID=A0A1H4GXN0_9BACI|nr:S9 family peptidase [Thalassobacillus cyri]SEB13432.1 Dipeptidyl aminopeptidase/acylaminoacyl peptidase [Thalassobacillus cyri]
MSEDKRPVTKDDIFNIQSVTNPKWSPDGKGVVFVKNHIDKEEDKYISNLFYFDKTTAEVNQWTYGESKNFQPKWSPDGNKVAFLSTREKKSQLHVLPLIGGEAQQITTCPNGVNDFEWSPDGKRIAFQALLNAEEGFDELKKEEKEDDKKDKVRVITKMKYKADGVGFVEDQEQQIGIVDITSREIAQLTDNGHSYALLSWSPDGKTLVFTGDEAENKDFSFSADLFLYDVESRERTTIDTEKGYVSDAKWSPDGSKLAFIFHGLVYKNASHPDIYILDRESGETTNVTDQLDLPVGDFTAGDIQQGAQLPGIVWLDDESFYFPVSEYGNVVLYQGNTWGKLRRVWNEKHHMYGFDVDVKTKEVAAVVSTTTSPGELYLFDTDQQACRKVTDFNGKWLRNTKLSEPEDFILRSVDSWDVHGWVMKPVDFVEGEKYPLIYQVHGGPHAMYGNTFFHEMQLLAAQGYVVAYVNPRGSHSYHQEFVNAVRGDYGGNDYVDVMNGLDYLLEAYDFIDGERLGLTGGSYGGFMTNWIVGHTDRFKAAVTQRCISNWISFYGVSDIGYYFSEWQIQADLHDFEKLWKHSPLAYVDNMETPLLIIHSENDLRCPIEQSEQLFIALKRQEKDTEFVRIPDADHNLSRTGKPSLRLERLQHLMRWFEEKL